MKSEKSLFSRETRQLSIQERRQRLEQTLNLSLDLLGGGDAHEAKFRGNCENVIGTVQVPIGVAGPLLINNPKPFSVYLPLATTEAALVASTHRGCRAIFLSGGATVIVEKRGISRAPCFLLPSAAKAFAFVKGAQKSLPQMKRFVRKNSSHTRLLKITSYLFGSTVYLRFVYDTEDAMGMNMATITTEKLVQEFLLKRDVQYVSLSGNMCVDKKPSAINFIEKRGFFCVAQVALNKKVLRKVLKTNAETLYETHIRKNLMGTAAAGSLAFNSHYANLLAALFTATGQDIAHVSESCVGMTTLEKKGDTIVFSVTLPDLPLGTVGGGTALPFQKKCLKILGVAGRRKSRKFAQIVAGGVCAGELSLLSALSAGHLSTAHEALRKKFVR